MLINDNDDDDNNNNDNSKTFIQTITGYINFTFLSCFSISFIRNMKREKIM